jgi:hypothetical protein
MRRVSILEQQVWSGAVDITTSGQSHGDLELRSKDIQHDGRRRARMICCGAMSAIGAKRDIPLCSAHVRWPMVISQDPIAFVRARSMQARSYHLRDRLLREYIQP